MPKKNVCVKLRMFKHMIKDNCVGDTETSTHLLNSSSSKGLSLELGAPTCFLHYSITFAKMVSVAFGVGVLVSSEQKG
jgi:hypothetical protein